MGRRKKRRLSARRVRTSCTRKQESSSEQSQVLSTNHVRLDAERGLFPPSIVVPLEESSQPMPVLVEPVSMYEMTDIPSRSCQTTPSLKGDAGLLEPQCLRVTFNPEKHNQSMYNDETTQRETSISPYQQFPTPSKDDVLSVVIEKLTELVKDSEKRQSQSSPSGVCGGWKQEAKPKRADPLDKCPKCECLFVMSAEQFQSKEAVLCQCCEKAQKTTASGATDRGSSSEEQTVKGKQTGYTTTKEFSKVKCELCSHVAGSYEDLLYHLLSEHADAKICKCKLCDFFTTVEARIWDHAAVHNAPHVYKCSSCPYVTKKLIDLQGHMKNHNKDRELLLKCSECGFSCRCEDILRTHMWEHIPSIHSTSTRAQTPNPREVIPTTVQTTSLDKSKPPSVPSPVLPTHAAEGEQPCIFKCLLCGYLCDRLATLKAHAWRHAGEKGCSYPLVDEDEYFKRSLSISPTTAFASADKPFPLAVLSSSKVERVDNTSKKEVAAREPSKISCGYSHGSGDAREEASSCRCEGINIPPSSVPLIKELLIQKKHENDGEVDKKTDQDLVSSAEASNQSCDPSTLHHNNSSSSTTQEFQQNDVAVTHPFSDGSYSKAGQGALGKQSKSNLHDPQVLVIDPEDPRMLFLDLDIPEPAAMVEAITEQTAAIYPEELETPDSAFIPLNNKIIRSMAVAVERPQFITTIRTDGTSFQTHSASTSLPISEEVTEIRSQLTVRGPKTVQDCAENIPQHVYKEIWENLTKVSVLNELRREVDSSTSSDDLKDSESDSDINLNIKSGLIDSVSSTDELSSSPGASQTNQGQRPVKHLEKQQPIFEEKLYDACNTETLKSQEKLTETLITAMDVSSTKLVATTPELGLRHPRSGLEFEQMVLKESALALEEDTVSQSKQENRVVSPCLNPKTDSEESALQITKQSELIQEKQLDNNTEIAPVVGGHKRGTDFTSDESPTGAKRVCRPVVNQDVNTQPVTDGQVVSIRDEEVDQEKNKTQVDTSSEEDSIVKFFMNIIEDSSEPFQCKLCSNMYETHNFLKHHLQTHLVHNSFHCPLCKERFESLDRLRYHIQEHYQESHCCSECSAFFYTKSELQAHRKSHTALKVFTCKECNATFSGQAEYISHCEMVHDDHEKTDVRCTHCWEGFRNTNNLLLHTLSCTMRKKRSCKECSFVSETTKSLQDHIKDCHPKTKFYKCTLCDYKSSAKNGIKNHMKFHTKDRPYRCQLCTFTGAYPQSLRSHMRMHMQPDWRPDCLPSELPEQYRCKLCCYTCNYLPSLKSHMWRHASDPKYSYKGKQNTSSNAPTTTNGTAADQSPHLTTSKHQSTSAISSSATQSPQQTPGVVCNLVTFCCQECGFQSTDRSKLVDHLKTHIPLEILDAGRKRGKEPAERKTKQRGPWSVPRVVKENHPAK